MQCPACRSTLYEENDSGIAIDRCGSCNGVWLDGKELTQIIEARERSFTDEVVEKVKSAIPKAIEGYQRTEDSGRICPRCSITLRPYNYAYSTGVIVDRCPECKGVWTDYGELEQIEVLMSNHSGSDISMDGIHDTPANPFGDEGWFSSGSNVRWRRGIFHFLFWHS
jgi:uncharacterized protein